MEAGRPHPIDGRAAEEIGIRGFLALSTWTATTPCAGMRTTTEEA